MHTLSRRLKRIPVTILAAAGLAYPACAAICPRGRGGCPFPGRCFLYVDADVNSLCDYTSPASNPSLPSGTIPSNSAPSNTAVVSSSSPSGSAVVPGQAPAGSVPLVQATSPTVPVQPDPGFFTAIPDAFVTGIAAGALLIILFFAILKSGLLGVKIDRNSPALAVAALFALGIASMVSCLLSGAEAEASLFAAVYLLAGSLLAAYAWKSGVMSRGVAIAAVIMSTAFGFVILAPLMPLEFAGLASPALLAGIPAPGILAILAGIVIALVIGRTFCGHICPVGSIQELAYVAPFRKITRIPPLFMELLRLVVFIAVVTAALYAVNLMGYTGVYEFFSLTLAVGFMVFTLLLCLSMVLYRPVCRGICPFGLLFSLPAHVSRYRLRRTGACISCRKCEKVCPTGVAGKGASKRECYLCARCTHACPVSGALVYGKEA